MEINKLLDQVENPLPELSESDYPSSNRKLFSNRKPGNKKEEDDSLIAGVSDDALKLAAAELMEE